MKYTYDNLVASVSENDPHKCWCFHLQAHSFNSIMTWNHCCKMMEKEKPSKIMNTQPHVCLPHIQIVWTNKFMQSSTWHRRNQIWLVKKTHKIMDNYFVIMWNEDIVLICVYLNAFFDIQIFTRSITLNGDEARKLTQKIVVYWMMEKLENKSNKLSWHTNILMSENESETLSRNI